MEQMEREKWWQQPENIKRLLRKSLWLIIPLIIFACFQVYKHKRSRSYLASDSTSIARGKISDPILIDTASISLARRAPSPFVKGVVMKRTIAEKIKLFYEQNNTTTKWLGRKSPTKEYYGLVRLLKEAPKHALVTETYDLREIENNLRDIYEDNGDISLLPELDMQISERYFLFTTHLKDGVIKPASHGKAIWKAISKQEGHEDVAALLKTSGTDLTDVIEKIQPPSDQYERLVAAYNKFIELDHAYKGDFHKITIKRKIKPGEKDSVIPGIRKRMSLFQSKQFQPPSDTVTGTPDSLLYDAELALGMKEFQKNHGLEPSGIIGGKTVMFLNMSFKQRAATIALNIERERWKPRHHSERYLVVNIPEFTMHAFTKGKEELSMKVIVGAPEKPTPVFNDMLEYIIFSPTWNVPTSIIEEEILPRMQEDPDYYSERNYTFYRNSSEIDPLDENWKEDDLDLKELKIVQQPGADNALGLVKFVMPNHLNIYLHDTPQQSLFKKTWRAFSHGCIRLDEPEKFAEYLLDEKSKWNRQTINDAMHGGEPKTVKLQNFHQVFVDYQTAWVNDDGQVNFRDDVYGHDHAQLKLLKPFLSQGV
jgi:L,D-transpeptidase YcbB